MREDLAGYVLERAACRPAGPTSMWVWVVLGTGPSAPYRQARHAPCDGCPMQRGRHDCGYAWWASR